MEFLRARRERRNALAINDPKPVEIVEDIWAGTAQMATVGIFIMLLGVASILRALLLPILAAVLVGMTLAPLVKPGVRGACRPG